MVILLVAVAVCMYCVAVLCASIVPLRSRYSTFERTRRHKLGGADIAKDVQRHATSDSVAGVLRVGSAVLLVTYALLMFAALGWLYGTVAAVIGVLFWGVLPRMSFVRTASQRLYVHQELKLLRFVERHQNIVRFFRITPEPAEVVRIASREELEDTIKKLSKILTQQERHMLVAGLQFDSMHVKTVMTPRSALATVQAGEPIGPLVLDELHKTGHTRFPVIDSDIDHVAGILHIQNLLLLHDKKTRKARDLMVTPVYYLKEDQTLADALAVFLHTHQHICIVVNGDRETVGMLTLEDTVAALLGRRVVDTLDAHDSLRAVAARTSRSRTASTTH